ncbi:RA domain-containing protein rau [Brevipalpus obovatus]|uniref:RA domain-containing protein rau n=1 Tax=Brevipalpus obovatus TaxID=246614 RepID=UPI003D9F1F4C
MTINYESAMFVVKVYAKVLCSDIEYKTLSIKYHTSAREMIQMLLNKFRMRHTDPNLFYLTMEVRIRNTGIPIRSVMVLEDKACPAQIQASYPHQETKFALVMKRGGLVKIYDSCLMSASRYKSLLISDHTTVQELIGLMLHCYGTDEKPAKFVMYEVGPTRHWERKLHQDEFPLRLQNEWPTQDMYHFELRRNNEEPIQKRARRWLF